MDKYRQFLHDNDMEAKLKKNTKKAKKKKVSYKRNYLSSVVLRIDFEPIELGFLKDFAKEIVGDFPYSEQKETIAGSLLVEFTTGKVEQTSQKNFLWIFGDVQKTKKLQIAQDHILVEYSAYKDSGILLNDVNIAVARFLQFGKVTSLLRIGLRYTNEINLGDMEKVVWSKYINEKLLGGLLFSEANNMHTARAMGKLVVKEENADITFNFGVWNADFPNQNLRKEFVLDYDCYSRLPVAVADLNILDVVKTYNQYIEQLFELSITKEFRKLLNK